MTPEWANKYTNNQGFLLTKMILVDNLEPMSVLNASFIQYFTILYTICKSIQRFENLVDTQ